MIMKMEIVIKTTTELLNDELNQISNALFREFKVPFIVNDESKDTLFFLLKQNEHIISMGAIHEVKPVFFNGENFIIYAALHVVSNVKNKGYGKEVVTSMKKYLSSQNKTMFGFCMPKNKGFYEKCGFSIETNSTKRFVYNKNNEKITNKDGQIIFYEDSSDEFMKKVIASPEKEVSIPTPSLW